MEALVNRTAWFADGVGEVASEESVRLFVNGTLESEVPSRTGWLDSGEWKGTTVP